MDRFVLDTNVLLDVALGRQPFCDKAKLLLELAYIGEFELWIGTSQVTDLIYVLTEGGKPSMAGFAKEMMSYLHRVVHVYATDERDYECVARSTWEDLEDAFVFQTASNVGADAIISRDASGFDRSPIKVMDCDELFEVMRARRGVDYERVGF